MNSFTNVHDFWLDEFIPIDEKLKFTCEFNEGKIISLDYVVGKVRVIFQINGYSNKENVKEIEIPKKEECGYTTEDDFYSHLSQITDLDINNCNFTTNGRIINAYVNEKVELNISGNIYYKSSIIKHVEQEDLYIEDVVFSEKGEYKVKVYTKYLGVELSTEVTAVVEKRVDSKNSYKVNELQSVAYGFTIDENTYLCDERYIYKFDKECKTLYGKLDLQCQGNCHYVKDGYLYVSANFPYLSTYNGEYGYYGSVTKINLSDFTIDKQVPIRSYPISIIVDNNDNVIISKGANQHVYNEVVNMDTGELSKAFFGYQGDFLLYDSKQDIIINVTRDTTSNNEIYKYNGKTWDYVGDSSIKCDEVYYYDNNMIVTDKGVYKYNESTNDYNLTKFYFNDNKTYLEVLYATSNGEKAYVVLGEDINTPKKIYTLDLESGIYSNVVLVDEQISSIIKREKYGENKIAGEKFLEENKTKEGVQTTASGLQYKVIKEGKGAIPTDSSTVKVNYKGTLIDGTEFDSSYKRNAPATFRANQVIKGWTEALTLMPVGSKWELYIPQELAYGARNAGQIKPFSTLIFEVELVSIEDK